jgi:hypothetical protein
MISSRQPCFATAFAIEKDRRCSVPGTAMSMYCPGWKRNAPGSGSASRTCEMSWLSSVISATVVCTVTTGSPDLIMSSS